MDKGSHIALWIRPFCAEMQNAIMAVINMLGSIDVLCAVIHVLQPNTDSFAFPYSFPNLLFEEGAF